jgi:hypothetical protein
VALMRRLMAELGLTSIQQKAAGSGSFLLY